MGKFNSNDHCIYYCGRRRAQLRIRWLDGITDSMDMSLRKLRELVVAGSLACCSHGVAKSWTRLNWTELMGFSNPELKEELTVVHTSHRCVCVPTDGPVVSFFCNEMSGIPDRLDLHSEWHLLIRVILRENFELKISGGWKANILLVSLCMSVWMCAHAFSVVSDSLQSHGL